MADDVKKNGKLNEDSIGYTKFGAGGPGDRMGPYFYPSGRLGQFLARFFATKAAPYLARQGDDGPTPQATLAGDTIQRWMIILKLELLLIFTQMILLKRIYEINAGLLLVKAKW